MQGFNAVAFAEILLIALALAMDAFTVALAVGLHLSNGNSIGPRRYFRLSFHFGLFQFLMPILGWVAGMTVRGYIETVDHWIAMGLLTYIGVKMIRDSGKSREYTRPDPTRGVSLIVLSIATSIDALASGLSMAILGVSIIYPSVVIGIVAAFFTLIGMRLGRRLGLRWRSKIAILGGLILIGIGLKILAEHLLGW
jgi:putative Mn2+ efflux pump MntP